MKTCLDIIMLFLFQWILNKWQGCVEKNDTFLTTIDMLTLVVPNMQWYVTSVSKMQGHVGNAWIHHRHQEVDSGCSTLNR